MEPYRIEELPLHLIRPPEDGHRIEIDQERIAALADSIATEGLHQPPGVRGPLEDGTYELIFGDRRRRAMQLLQRPTMPARVYAPDVDVLLVRASENHNREQLTPLEEARVAQRFADTGRPVSAIARLMRRSPAWVADRLALMRFPPELQEAVHRGDVPLTVARALVEVDDRSYRDELLREAVRTGAKTATVELWVAHYKADRARIVGNLMTVEEIAERREAWVITVGCEGCAAMVPYERTRSFRVCAECYAAMEAELRTAAPRA